MNRRAALIVFAALSFLPVVAVGAQLPFGDNGRILRFGFSGGVIVPRTGATIHTLKTGVQGQGYLLLQLPGGLPAIRLNADYAKMNLDSAISSATGSRTVLDAVAGLKINLLPGPIRPYVLAGVGAFDVKDIINATSGATGTAATTLAALNYGIDGGAGITLKLGPIDAVVETRIQNVWTKKAGLIDTRSIQSFPVSFGILF